MKPFGTEQLIQFGYRYVTRTKGRFYLHLAVLCSLLVIVDAGSLQLISGMRLKTFDVIMKHRLFFHQADPDLVIVDIDEGSLAAMAKDYGRWPWPRQVFAEFLEILQEQRPQAVVFDILFSDPDIYNPDSDAYFNEVAERIPNTFFPMLRLAAQNDATSQVTPAMIPGMEPVPGKPQEDKGLAVVLPSFSAILASNRIGTNNIYPDRDGIVRQYPMYRDHFGWRIPSLPRKIADTLGWTLPGKPDVYLNWRGRLGAFRSVRFSEVFEDFLHQERQRPPDEFTGKIIIIGSTAPNLFDTKPTPMERIHPGVEILATAIDNLKHGDWITHVKNPWVFTLLALGLIWATALAFMTGVNRKWIDGIFASSQIGLIAVTFASLNFSTLYVDLTAPITTGLIYFSLARVYAYAETTLLEKYVWLNVEEGVKGWQHAEITVLHVHDLSEGSESKFLTALKRDLNSRKPGFTVEPFPRKPAGIGKAYQNLFLIYYVENSVKNGQWASREHGENCQNLVQEVVQAICAQNHRGWHTGHSQGALPYGDEKNRIQAWQQLVTRTMLHLREQEGLVVS